MENDLDQLGLLIDQAADEQNIDKLDQAIGRCQQFLSVDASVGCRSIVHYFLANAGCVAKT